ncbi:MAG: nucleotidyltransferase family protein [Clostridia bacterium]|nr:nucleotidyltransferase family protein [Clostridia bacterium]
MKISAVICEFSPFHLGHEYLLKKVKEESDAVIAIMSGAFTERGEAGIISKYARAHAALCGGADIVLELPFPFSSCGAEKFAFGGVAVADALGCVDEIWCGSECGDTAQITHAAARLTSAEFKNALTARGERFDEPFGRAYFETYRALYGDTPVFSGSNDILAVAYARALIERGSKIKLRTTMRRGESFSGEGGGFASATKLREMILSGRDISSLVPDYSAKIIADEISRGGVYDTELLFPALAGIYRVSDTTNFSSAYESNEELYNRIKSAFHDSASFSEVIERAQTKRYSPSKVRRAILFSALGVSGWDVIQPYYTVLLGADGTGCEILKSIEKTAGIDIVTKPADYSSRAYDLMQKAEALLTLCRRRPAPAGEFMKASPVII